MNKMKFLPMLFVVAIVMTGMVSIVGCGGNSKDSSADKNLDNADSAWSYFTAKTREITNCWNKRQFDSIYMKVPAVMEESKAHEQWYYYYFSWAFKICAFAAETKADEANQELQQMMADVVKRNNQVGESLSHMCMAAIYTFCNIDLEHAADEYKQALHLYPPEESYAPKDWMYGVLTQVLAQLQDVEGLDSLIQENKADLDRVAEQMKSGKMPYDKRSYAIFCVNHFHSKSIYHYWVDDHPEAFQDADSIDSINTQVLDTLEGVAVMSFNVRFNLLFDEERFDELEALLNWADTTLKHTPELRKMLYRDQLEFYKHQGNYEAALTAYDDLFNLQDSASTADTRAKLDELNKRFEIDSVKHKAELQKSHFTSIIAICVAVAFALLLALGMWSRSRLRKKNTQLRIAYDQLEETTTIKERMASELRIARDIQMSMVPSVFPDYEGLDMYASMTPAKEVGGDLYGYVLLGDKLYFALGDVSGKGVPASLFMAQATRLFRTLAAQQMMPAEICTRMNDALSGEDNESGMFVTFFLGLLDLTTGHLDFCNAGHNPPVIGGGDNHGDFLEMIPNAPIGLFPGLEYEGEEIENVKGRPLFIYTDGLNEAENPQQEQFGDDRLLEFLRNTQFSSAQNVIEAIKADVEQHRNGAEPNDDLTMMCIRTW